MPRQVCGCTIYTPDHQIPVGWDSSSTDNLPASPSLNTITTSCTATYSLSPPTKTVFGHLFQIRWWKLSLGFWVPPCTHFNIKLSELKASSYTGLMALVTKRGRAGLFPLSKSPLLAGHQALQSTWSRLRCFQMAITAVFMLPTSPTLPRIAPP